MRQAIYDRLALVTLGVLAGLFFGQLLPENVVFIAYLALLAAWVYFFIRWAWIK